jgi:8-amino-7-oxononanoate synthase
MNLPIAQSAIVPLIIGDNDATVRMSKQLKNVGFLVSAIRPPTVPKDTSRLRFTFCSNHCYSDIDRLTSSLKQILKSENIHIAKNN